MTEAVDYFSNHALKLRFPWRLYHGPIVPADSPHCYEYMIVAEPVSTSRP